jgi:hypothetical protein
MQSINVISKGLIEIGNNNLTYRIPFENMNDEFGAIARAISDMAKQLNDNIQKLYVYQLKQKSAELAISIVINLPYCSVAVKPSAPKPASLLQLLRSSIQ